MLQNEPTVELTITPLGNSLAETNRNLIQLNSWLQKRKKVLFREGIFEPELKSGATHDEGSLSVDADEILIKLAPTLVLKLIDAIKNFVTLQNKKMIFEFKIEQKDENRTVTLKYNKDELQNEKKVLTEILNQLAK